MGPLRGAAWSGHTSALSQVGSIVGGKSWGCWPTDVDAYKQLLEARDADRC